MGTQLLLMILETVFGFVIMGLLVRFYMQLSRASFRNPMGQFVIAITDWLVKPARRILPSLGGMDLPTLVMALVLQALLLAISFLLHGLPSSGGGFVIGLLLMAMLELVKLTIYLLIGVVLGVVILSWVNPQSPIAPTLNSLSQPFLRPIQRVIPSIGGVDVSPMVLLLILQVLLTLLASARGTLLPIMVS